MTLRAFKIPLTRLQGPWRLWRHLCESLWDFDYSSILWNDIEIQSDGKESLLIWEEKTWHRSFSQETDKHSLSIFVPLKALSCISLKPLLYMYLQSVTRLQLKRINSWVAFALAIKIIFIVASLTLLHIPLSFPRKHLEVFPGDTSCHRYPCNRTRVKSNEVCLWWCAFCVYL